MQISALVPEIFKFNISVKYANAMADDIIHSTQYYIRYIDRANLANLHILKTCISLERKEIFGKSQQHFSSHTDFLSMFYNGLDRKDVFLVIVPLQWVNFKHNNCYGNVSLLNVSL